MHTLIGGLETREYNGLNQLTHITAYGVNMQYVYTDTSHTENNGQISQATDVVCGEQISYASAFAVIPFTLIVIMPINKKLLDPALDRTSEATHRLLQDWGILHAVRSLLSLVAAILFLSSVIGA